MAMVSAATVLVEELENQGVSKVFGLIGSAGMEVFDALYDRDTIRFIGVRDERTGMHMADGYARASGRPGVFLAGQNGPGATNLVTGLAQAKAAYSPVVALAGSLSSGHVYRDAFQEVDQQALFTPVTKKTWTVPSADRVGEIVAEAFRVAITGRPGPVVVNLPRDILSELVRASEQRRAPIRYFGPGAGNIYEIERAAKLLASADRPVILAGGGVKNGRSHSEVLELAEMLGAPVAMSPGHGDAVPFAHPLSAGQAGPRGNEVASNLLRDADVILALGTRVGFNTTFYSAENINTKAALIQVEIEPSALGRFFDVEVGIHGDAGLTAKAMIPLISELKKGNTSKSRWLKDFMENRNSYLSSREEESQNSEEPIQPATLFKAMRKVFPKDVMVTMDAGTLCLQATDRLNYHTPPSLFTPLDFGLVGFSYACGLGVKLACPDRTVVSLMGDGGFGMAHSEISTAIAEGINTVTIVMNNGCWGAEKAYQRDFFGERYLGADIVNAPWDKLAELWGAKGFRIDKVSDIESVLAEALACDAPAIVDVFVDPNALFSFRKDSFAHRSSKKEM